MSRSFRALVLVGSWLVAVSAWAATKNWNDGTDNWSNGADWTPAGVPGAGDAVNIVFADGVARTVTYDYTGPAVTLDSLTLDLTNAGANASTLSMSANNLSTRGEIIGVNGVATFTQSGGSNSVNSDGLTLGSGSAGAGTYNLSGGLLSVGGGETIGSNGLGTFTQTAGSNFANELNIGSAVNGRGTYMLGGGLLETFGITVGVLATGSGGQSGGGLTQTGGTLHTYGSITIASGPGSTGSVELSNGTLISNNVGSVGYQGTGTFTQTGGSLTSSDLTVGEQVGSSGTLSLSGGISTISDIFVGGGLFNNGGAGVVTVSGTNTVANVPGKITVRNTPGSVLSLQSGTLNVNSIDLGGIPSLFSWTGGTLNITNYFVNWDSGGAPSSTSTVFGSALSLSSSRTLKVDGSEVIGGNGAFSLSVGNGVHTVTGNITLKPGGSISQSSSGTIGYASFTQAGGTISSFFRNTANFTYQSGSITAQFVNDGTMTLASSLTISNSFQNDALMTVGAGQTFSATSGTTNYGSFTLAGGTIGGSTAFTNTVGGTFTAHGTISPSLTNNGTMICDGVLSLNSLTNNGVLQGTGTLSYGSNQIQNNAGGVINATTPGGALVLAFSLANSAGAVVNVGPTSTFSVAQNWGNSGIVNLQGAGSRLSGGTITNSSLIQGFGTITSSFATSWSGILRANGGELDYTASGLSNNGGGQIQVFTGSTLMVLQGMTSNANTIALTGGTFDNNNHTLTNNGTINGYGTIRTSGLTNSSTRLLAVGEGNMDVFGNFTNNGVVNIQTGRTAYFYNTVSGSGSFSGGGTAVFLNTLSPGNSPALVNFAGGATLGGGTSLVMELGGSAAGTGYDKIHVDGLLSIGGALSVSLINGFAPAAGDAFDLLDWGTLSGVFSSLQLPSLGGSLAWDATQLYTSGVLSVISVGVPGDYNNNGMVDSADYVLWRKGGPLANEVDAPGTVNGVDYTAWRARFGNPGGSGSTGGSLALAVPEPASSAVLIMAALAIFAWKRPYQRPFCSSCS
jgi:fibronectin-binding autotransporter adhesin